MQNEPEYNMNINVKCVECKINKRKDYSFTLLAKVSSSYKSAICGSLFQCYSTVTGKRNGECNI